MSRQVRDKKRKRLLLFTNQRLSGGLKGGMERHMELIAKYVDRDRFEVFGIVPEDPTMNDFAQSLGEYTDALARITMDRDHPTNFLRFVKQVKTWGIDVMHVHNGWYLGQNIALVAARLGGARRLFITEHQAPQVIEPVRFRIGNRITAQLVAGFISVSDHNLETRVKYLYTPKEKAFIVDNGVDTDGLAPVDEETLRALRRRLHLPENASIVGTLVRFEPDKGLSYLFDAMPQIIAASPNAHVLMVGDGSLRQTLEQQAARLGFADRVRFVGFVREPRSYLALMDAFVLPVPVGSMSIAALEAMAMSLAVIITFGGDGEAVVHNETGLRATPRDPQSIAQQVISVLNDAELKTRLGRAARQHIEKHFSARTTARKLERLYAGD